MAVRLRRVSQPYALGSGVLPPVGPLWVLWALCGSVWAPCGSLWAPRRSVVDPCGPLRVLVGACGSLCAQYGPHVCPLWRPCGSLWAPWVCLCRLWIRAGPLWILVGPLWIRVGFVGPLWILACPLRTPCGPAMLYSTSSAIIKLFQCYFPSFLPESRLYTQKLGYREFPEFP